MFFKWFQLVFVLGLALRSGFCESVDNKDEAGNRLILTPFSPKCFTVEDECPNENVTLYLYRKDRQDDPFILNVDTIKEAPIDKDLPIKILVHGYTGDHNFSPNQEIRPAYFEVGDMNVISVGYGNLVKDGCYLQAVKNLRTVGHCVADILEAGIAAGSMTLSQVHVIGFSLGAHVAGFVQQYMTSGNISRVTGLDPALPLLALKASEHVLSKDDGEFVDVVHTNAGLAGKILPVGDIDFYANGGIGQSGCLKYNFTNPIGCDHNRAPQYYAESITSDVGFYGLKCTDYISFKTGLCNKNKAVIMGEKVPHDARGIYFFETKDAAPYALGNPKKSNSRFPQLNLGGITNSILGGNKKKREAKRHRRGANHGRVANRQM